MSDVVQLGGTFNKVSLPYLGHPQLVYALLEMRPGTGTAVGNVRLPLNFSLVLDRSGSMYGEEIRQLREAVKWVIDQLEPEDMISVVAFNNRTEVLVERDPGGGQGRTAPPGGKVGRQRRHPHGTRHGGGAGANRAAPRPRSGEPPHLARPTGRPRARRIAGNRRILPASTACRWWRWGWAASGTKSY